jgi:zinc protease
MPNRFGNRAAAMLLAAALCGAGSARAAPAFPADTFTLANGLQVVVLPSHRAPIVVHMVWYKAGAADETPGKSGIAHFVEHLMFKGTTTMEPGEFARTVAANGGNDNAFTTHDYTAYYENLSADRLPLAMKLESDRMANLVLSDDVVLPEREVILEERRTRIDNSPQALLDEQIDAALYLNEPYHRPTIGWESEMHGLTTGDALAFYRTWYWPNNAVVVIAGDVDTGKVRALAEQYYGPLPSHPVPRHPQLEEPPKVAAIQLSMTSALAGSPTWSRSYLAPSYNYGKTEDAYALQLLAEILGGSATSRLYRDLVEGKGLALDAGAYYDPSSRGLSSFSVYCEPKKQAAIDTAVAEIEKQLQLVLKDGVTASELDKAKKRLQARLVYEQDSLGATARLVGVALATGRTLDDVEAWPDRIGAVTAEQVAAAARDVIHDDVGVTGYLRPAPNAGAPPSPFRGLGSSESVR